MVLNPNDIKLDKDGYVIVEDKKFYEEKQINKELHDFFAGLSDKTPKFYANINNFAKTFEKRSSRWQKMVTPLIVIFVLFSVYGFFLIFSLTTNMNKMTETIGSMTTKVSYMSDKMKTLTPMVQNMQVINSSVSQMNDSIKSMNEDMDKMVTRIKHMDSSTANIALNNNLMSQDVSRLGHNIGRPMQFFNSFMPF
jgi:uncharacterized coiled-coil protein SlyX